MIQVLGLRDFTHGKLQRKRETFFSKGWRFEHVQDVFNPKKLTELLATVPKEEHYNLYYTVADCFEESGRKLKEQWAIPFDIDELQLDGGNELKVAETAARAACLALGVPYEETAVVFSGHGVQFFILLDTPIVSDDHFDRTRAQYSVLVQRIQNKLNELGIPGKVDPSVWSKGRLMRLPGTENRKPGKTNRTSVLLNSTPVPRAFDVVLESGVPVTETGEVMSDEILKRYPKPDTKAVCTGCKFLVWCKEKPAEVKDPEWYRELSILARLENGRELSHEYSSGHPNYNHYETENKIDQALMRAGPATCKYIDATWGQCHTCEYYGKITSPIMIKGPDYIASRDFGFRKQTSKGTPGQPDYQDLIREFTSLHPYKVIDKQDETIIFNGKHWEFASDIKLRAWAMATVRPPPNSAEMREFVTQLKAHNVTSIETLNGLNDYLLNFKNGVVDTRTREKFPHSAEYGFFSVLPYDYDPRATAPTWERFLLDIMNGDAELAELMKEFGGYSISGDPCWLQKALLLIGEGANGKSVYMEVLGAVVGKDFYSSVTVRDLEKDVMRYLLVNKLFNYSEETAKTALSDSDTFKAIINGGDISVKQLYSQPYFYPNRAKIIMAANESPYSQDRSYGFLRRLVIVNLERKFIPGEEGHDYHIKDKLLKELPGICNSLMDAYAKLKERGHLIGKEKTGEALRQYQAESDTVLMFIEDHVEEITHPEAWVKNAEVYESYRMMCEANGHRPVNNIAFGRQLAKLAPNIKRDRIKLNGNVIRVLRGIKLNKEF